MNQGPLWISEQDVEGLVDPGALVAAIEAGFLAAESGAMREPGSTRLDGLDGGDSYLTLYPAHCAGGFATAKILAGRPTNAHENRPEIDAILALVDPPTGRIAALLSARALTALRTAAATAAVLRRLLRRAPARIGLIGTGGQARAHARILAAMGLASGFMVASPRGDAAKAEAAAEAIGSLSGLPAAAAGVAELAASCDVIVCLSLAARPLPLGAARAEAVIAGIGPFYPHAHEIDPALVAGAAFVVSDDPVRLRRQWSGSDLLDAGALALVPAADLLADRVRPPPDGRRMFLSDGRAFQDNVAATLVYRAAVARGFAHPLP
jgi:ornithine cyclodeaminase/alanine dehydrogenase-like protein (mu-crystallin family)